MDEFREKQNSNCSKGGIHCECCNPFRKKRHGTDKPKLNRIARHELKAETEKIVKEWEKKYG